MNKKKLENSKNSIKLKNVIAERDVTNLKEFIKEKNSYIQEIIRKTIISIKLNKMYEIFSNNDITLSLNILNDLYEKTNEILTEPYEDDYKWVEFIPQNSEMGDFMELQRRNLLNVDYSDQISRKLTGKSFHLGNTARTTDDDTGILHYTFFLLSEVVAYFQKLGFKHVNIIDDSCRFMYASQMPLAREQSATEKVVYDTMVSKWDSTQGGTKRKRKMKKTKKVRRRQCP
jgi:hypothetical protein